MRTNIELDDRLVREAMDLTGETTKRGVVALALDELVKRRQRLSLSQLYGRIQFAEGYDYKDLRVGER